MSTEFETQLLTFLDFCLGGDNEISSSIFYGKIEYAHDHGGNFYHERLKRLFW